MPSKRIRINYAETTKEVKADVSLEVAGEDVDNDAVLAEARELFEEAFKAATELTVNKIHSGKSR